MKSARELIEELNTLDEQVSIEAKASSEMGQSVMETICAFANEPHLGGGHLILGVSPASDSFWPIYEAVGVSNPDQLQSDIATQCASVFNIAIRPQIVVEDIDGKAVLVVFVPEAGAHEKPIHFKNQPLPKSARRRIGPTDQQCTDDDMIAFYADRQTQSHDENVLPDARLDDLDDEAVELYRQLRNEVDPSAEELKWGQNELLEALGAVKGRDGELRPTVAGVLLFGKPIALRRLFPMMRVDYIRIPGTQWVKDPDRRFDTVEIRAPLIRAIQRARSAVLDDLPKAFSLPAGELQGKELPMLPDRVVREVIANAVMHRDYRVHGSIQIIRYANRLEVRNPGYSIKSEDRLGEPGSQTRNPKIAAVLHDVKFAESKGSGIRVMRELMAENNLGAPTLESDRTDNSFLAILLFHHFLGSDDLEWLNSFEDAALDETEMKAMISAREVGAINNSTFRGLNRGTDTLSASRHLRKLVDVGLLDKRGSGSGTFYVPSDRAMERWPLSSAGEAKTPEHNAESIQYNTEPTQHEAKSIQLVGKSIQLAGKSIQLPAEIQQALESLGRRAAKGAVQRVILKLLAWKELSAAQLAELLGRTALHVRNEYLPTMLNAGMIVKSNPDNPTDPRMTYTVKDRSSVELDDEPKARDKTSE